ncbi:hypothetical protein SEPCBS119000_000703 [Sporothrix epigloea]|uniref:SET domain-containing protein n=1 Tax=Sporothrix epigloea TaxID=1892477 RepID=A0ABP0D6J7_9PEZI
MAGPEAALRMVALLEQRHQLTHMLTLYPYDLVLYLRRAVIYTDMGYPDLAASDAFRAVRLCYEIIDEKAYYKQAFQAIRGYAVIVDAKDEPAGLPRVMRGVTLEQSSATSNDEPQPDEEPDPYKPKPFADYIADDNSDSNSVWNDESKWNNYRSRTDSNFIDDPLFPLCVKLASIARTRCHQIIALNLLLCGCLGSAYEICEDGLEDDPGNRELLQIKALVDTAGRQRLRQSGGHDDDYDPADLPDRGFARREVYPWNTFEPHRCSDASLAFLNEQLAKVAPKCEVRAVQLPVLSAQHSSECAAAPENWQLGIFAKEPIAAGEVVLREYSVLTASNRNKAEACDACGFDILSDTKNAGDKENSSVDRSISCNDCCAVYCDEECYDQALGAYRTRNFCWEDFASPDKKWGPRDANDTLYLLLATRVLTMAERQRHHPLELKEVKYLWGDFVPAATNAQGAISSNDLSPYSPEVVAMAAAGGNPPAAWSLPFDFTDHIIKPLVFMDVSGVDIYCNPVKRDAWVLNTLFAKLRGTASARKSRQDGPPDMAAVYPLWSLTNHDCDPNVTWEWGDRMVLRAKEERVKLVEGKAAGITRPGGIVAGEEILSHYCDVNLPVQLRRDWVRGTLGGTCMCQRCLHEAATEQGDRKPLAENKANPACTCSCYK